MLERVESEIQKINKLVESNQLPAALDLVDQGIKTYPDETHFLKVRADISLQLGRPKDAIAALERSVSLDPIANGYFLLASAKLHTGDLQGALRDFQHAMEKSPEWYEGWEVYSRALFYNNDISQAEKAFEKAKSIQRATAMAHWEKQVEVQMGPRKFRRLKKYKLVRAAAKLLGGFPPVYRDQRYLGRVWWGWLGNSGHLDTLVKARKLGWTDRVRYTAIVDNQAQVGNDEYLSLWSKFIKIETHPTNIAKSYLQGGHLFEPLHSTSLNGVSMPIYKAAALVQREWERKNKKPLVGFSRKEKQRGWEILTREMNFPKNVKVVCLHVRDNGFWDTTGDKTNFSRSSDINSYDKCINFLLDKGYHVVRMGDSTMPKLNNQHPRLYDYATSSAKSKFMDIFLISISEFLVCTNSSLYWVAVSLGIPTVMTNWLPIGVVPLQKRDIILYKHVYSDVEKRFLTASEICQSPLKYIWSTNYLERNSLTVQENTSDDLKDACQEMVEGLRSRSIDVDPQQGKFAKVLEDNGLIFNGRVSRNFIGRNRNLFCEGAANAGRANKKR